MSLFTRCTLQITAPTQDKLESFISKHFKDVEPSTDEDSESYQFFHEGYLTADNLIATGYTDIVDETTIKFSFRTIKKPPIDQFKKLIQATSPFQKLSENRSQLLTNLQKAVVIHPVCQILHFLAKAYQTSTQ